MTRLGNKAVVALAVFGLFVGSGIALADSHQEEKNDTVFNFGYDPDNQFLVWNISSLDYEPDDEALLGALYDNFDDLLAACSLTPEVADRYSVDDQGTISLFLGMDPAEIPDGCESLTDGGVVTGPNGQVNHGMFMKLFNSLYKGPGKGCLVRHLAHSDLGKTPDTKVQADPDYEASTDPVVIDGATIEFTSAGADCVKGKKAEEDGTGGGPPAHVLEKKAAKQAEKWGEGGKPGKGPKNDD